MAEIIGRIVVAIIQGLIELLFEHTGRKILSFFGVKNPNLFVRFPVGFLFWVIFGCALAGTIAGIIERHS